MFFQPGDRVRVIKTSVAGHKYMGIEGTVVKDNKTVLAATMDREAQIAISGAYNPTGAWHFYKPTWEMELINVKVEPEDWS